MVRNIVFVYLWVYLLVSNIRILAAADICIVVFAKYSVAYKTRSLPYSARRSVRVEMLEP